MTTPRGYRAEPGRALRAPVLIGPVTTVRTGPCSTCPSSTTFKSGKFTNVRNQDGTQAWTPVPAIQMDPSSNGFVVTSSDVECPDLCGTGTLITVHAVRPNPSDPTMPQMFVTGHSITVPPFVGPNQSTFGAPQKNTTKQLNVLDGRLEHAVSAIDPTNGKVVIWTGHAVMKGTTSTEFRWYEIDISKPTVIA